MADIKNMPDALPLISLNSLKAARLTAESESVSVRVQTVNARVVSSSQIAANTASSATSESTSQYQLTLDIGGRSLQVTSEQALPKDTQLKLQLLIESRRQTLDSSAALPADDVDTSKTTQESVKQIRVLAINNISSGNSSPSNPDLINPNSSNNAQLILSDLSRTTTQAVTTPLTLAASLKHLGQLIQQANKTGEALTNPPRVSQRDINQWLAQKLPLADITKVEQKKTQAHSGVYHNPAMSKPQATDSDRQGNTSQTLNRVLPVIQQILAQPKVPAEVKQAIRQYLAQLTSASELQGSQQQIQHSGLSFEAKLVKLLVQAASSPSAAATGADQNKTPPATQTNTLQTSTRAAATTNHPVNNQQPVNDSSATGSLFRHLWQQADGLTRATSSATTPAALDAKVSDSAKTSISDLLAATKAKLETSMTKAAHQLSGSTDATLFANRVDWLTHQLQQLQSHDQKAVLSKSLQLWLNQINASRVANNDTPQTLQQLSNNLQERLPDGFRLLQSALAQIELEQLQRLNHSNDQWQVTLPLFVRHDQQLHEVQLQLIKDADEPDTETTKKQQQRWRIHLHFELQQLGALDVDVDMRMPRMAATFWSTQASTLATLKPQLTSLRSQLAQLGVEVDTLSARHGRLPDHQRNQIHTSLVDIHT